MNKNLTRTDQMNPKHRDASYIAKWHLRILICGVLSPLLLTSVSFSAGPPPMPVETMEVQVTNARQDIAAVGTLQSNESVILSSEIPGRITAIHFAEGNRVNANKLLIQLDDSILKAQFDQAQANLSLHEADYLRTETLLKDHAISQQEHDTAYARWLLDKASVQLAKAQWEKTRIVTPFDGTLGLRHVSLGDFVQPGQQLVNLEDIQSLKVEFPVPEKYAIRLKRGQSFSLHSSAFEEREFAGEIYAINPLIDTASRSVIVRGRLDNSDKLLRPGQFVEVKLNIDKRENALFIPEQAVIPQPQTNLVYKVVDGKAMMAPVKLGQRQKGWVEVLDGLVAGDRVVTGGHQKIGPGSPVQEIPADPALFAKLN